MKAATSIRRACLGLVMFCLAVTCTFAQAVEQVNGAPVAQNAPGGSSITGRLGLGALAFPAYSGGTGYDVWPVPLASVEIGDYAYIDYWQAGLYLWSNTERTLGLAVIAAPRLGFNASAGGRLTGMATRRSSLQGGLSLDYQLGKYGLSLGYLTDVNGTSDGGAWRLLAERRFELAPKLGMDAFVMVERLDSRTANYYFGVQAAEATATRPSYQPGAATTVGFGLHFNYDFGQRSTLLFGQEYTRLSDPLANSPIVVARSVNMFYLGYGWRL